jgi:hypothetical protein
VTACDRTRPNVIERVVVSTTDELGWAASRLGVWSAADGDLDGALAHLARNAVHTT